MQAKANSERFWPRTLRGRAASPLSCLVLLAIGMVACAPAAADSNRAPLELRKVLRAVSEFAEYKGEGLSFEQTGGRPLGCHLRAYNGVCRAGFWGYSATATNGAGKPSAYAHRDCRMRLRIQSSYGDLGGWVPELHLVPPVHCRSYESSTPVSPLWGFREYAEREAALLSEALPYAETDHGVTTCDRFHDLGTCHVDYRGWDKLDSGGYEIRECEAWLEARVSESGNVLSTRLYRHSRVTRTSPQPPA
jgi:hypothetical protein